MSKSRMKSRCKMINKIDLLPNDIQKYQRKQLGIISPIKVVNSISKRKRISAISSSIFLLSKINNY